MEAGAAYGEKRRAKLAWPTFVVTTALLIAMSILALLKLGDDRNRLPDVSVGAGSVETGALLESAPLRHAVLNATSAALMIAGFVFVRKRMIGAHLTCMLLAVLSTSLFLASYVHYHYHVGSRPFPGGALARALYFGILIPHTMLAALVVPLVGTLLFHAFRWQIDRHKRLARWTLPIWLFVSVSGVAVYLMLYVWFPTA